MITNKLLIDLYAELGAGGPWFILAFFFFTGFFIKIRDDVGDGGRYGGEIAYTLSLALFVGSLAGSPPLPVTVVLFPLVAYGAALLGLRVGAFWLARPRLPRYGLSVRFFRKDKDEGESASQPPSPPLSDAEKASSSEPSPPPSVDETAEEKAPVAAKKRVNPPSKPKTRDRNGGTAAGASPTVSSGQSTETARQTSFMNEPSISQEEQKGGEKAKTTASAQGVERKLTPVIEDSDISKESSASDAGDNSEEWEESGLLEDDDVLPPDDTPPPSGGGVGMVMKTPGRSR